ncbi:MAG: aspartate 1-decarboxylase [Candidatus Omnitrophica bacterium]|nr:aspartate 1-decarboxylase [Candidatus Omnitrophota bacterium]MBI3020904.1 aspartate 1-decarboxylase [Candidatus Omnitrophota bacterium]MBI3083875.1 aspartate 1-decarboxylase [Candidatus Omnitrophota bacterium]
MLRTVCKSKLHGATVTEANVQYTGSLTLDAELMQAADLAPYEQVHVVDVDNGARVVTYCIEGAAGSGTVCVNGAAARLISAGDKIIVISYVHVTPEELEGFAPKVIVLDQRNHIREVIPRPNAVSCSDTAPPTGGAIAFGDALGRGMIANVGAPRDVPS